MPLIEYTNEWWFIDAYSDSWFSLVVYSGEERVVNEWVVWSKQHDHSLVEVRTGTYGINSYTLRNENVLDYSPWPTARGEFPEWASEVLATLWLASNLPLTVFCHVADKMQVYDYTL